MRRRLVTAGIAAMVVLGGCGGGQGTGQDDDGVGDVSAQQSGDSAADLVRLLPDVGPGSMLITFGDVDAIAVANGVPVPEDGDVDGLLAWGRSGEDSGVPVLLPGQLQGGVVSSHEEYAEELGVSLWGTERYAGVDSPPTHVTLLEIDDPGEKISGALGDPDGDIWALGEEGRVDLTQTSVARPRGEALRLAVTDSGHAVISSHEKLAKTSVDESSSLATGEIGEVIDRLSDEGIVSGVIASTSAGAGRGGNGDGGDRGEGDGGDGSSDTEVAGVGFGVDGEHGDGVFARLVLGYGDDERASHMREDVREFFTDGETPTGQSWSGLITVADVEAVGSTVVVEVTFAEGQSPQSLVTLIMQGPTGLPGG